MQRMILPSIIVIVLLALAGIGNQQGWFSFSGPTSEVANQEELAVTTKKKSMTDTLPTAVITTSAGEFTLELDVNNAPETAGNFIKLAKEGFYDGTRFHRVIPDFMIQGGDPLSKDEANKELWGTGGPGYQFPDEFHPDLTNVTGSIAMANSGADTNGSQFFINVADNTFLDFDKPPLTSKHAVFGRVTSGMDVVLGISAADRDGRDRPLKEIVIESVVIEE